MHLWNENGDEIISSDYTFETLSKVAKFKSTKVLRKAETTATIEYSAEEKVQGQLEYGASTSYGSRTTKETSFNYSTHIQTLSGLKSGTTYHYRLHFWNKNGDETISSDYIFKTESRRKYGGGMHSQTELEMTKKSILINGSIERNAYNILIRDANKLLLKKSEAKEILWAYYFYADLPADKKVEQSRAGNLYAGYIGHDGSAIYKLAMAYKLSGNVKYADKAIELLDSWATINKGYKGFEYQGFVNDLLRPWETKNYFAQTTADHLMSEYGAVFIQSAILLKDYNGWSKNKRDKFSSWCRDVYRKSTDSILGNIEIKKDSSWDEKRLFSEIVKKNSWLFGNIGPNVRLGVTLHHVWEGDKKAVIDIDIPLLKAMLDSQIRSTVHLGKTIPAMLPIEQRRGIYALIYSPWALLSFSAYMQVVYNETGIDLFKWKNKNGYTLEDAVERLFIYAKSPEKWPYREGGAYENAKGSIEKIGGIPLEKQMKPDNYGGKLFYSMSKKYGNHPEWLKWSSSTKVFDFGAMNWNLNPLISIEKVK